ERESAPRPIIASKLAPTVARAAAGPEGPFCCLPWERPWSRMGKMPAVPRCLGSSAGRAFRWMSRFCPVWMARLDGEVAIECIEGLATVLGHPNGVGNATGLVAVDAPHPGDDVQRHAGLENGRVALFEAQHVTLVPARCEGDADGVTRAGHERGADVVLADDLSHEIIRIRDGNAGANQGFHLV